jgi:hypothetical protein
MFNTLFKTPRTKGEQNGRGVMLIASLILAVGGYYALEILWFLHGSVAVPGVVVASQKEINPNKRGPDKTDLYLIVEFADAAGKKHQLKKMSNSEEDGIVGTAFTVYYPPANASKARLGGRYLWWVPSGCLVVGGFLFGAGLFFVLLSRFLVWLGMPMRPSTGCTSQKD